jgi:hypothetical protein
MTVGQIDKTNKKKTKLKGYNDTLIIKKKLHYIPLPVFHPPLLCPIVSFLAQKSYTA